MSVVRSRKGDDARASCLLSRGQAASRRSAVQSQREKTHQQGYRGTSGTDRVTAAAFSTGAHGCRFDSTVRRRVCRRRCRRRRRRRRSCGGSPVTRTAGTCRRQTNQTARAAAGSCGGPQHARCKSGSRRGPQQLRHVPAAVTSIHDTSCRRTKGCTLMGLNTTSHARERRALSCARCRPIETDATSFRRSFWVWST